MPSAPLPPDAVIDLSLEERLRMSLRTNDNAIIAQAIQVVVDYLQAQENKLNERNSILGAETLRTLWLEIIAESELLMQHVKSTHNKPQQPS